LDYKLNPKSKSIRYGQAMIDLGEFREILPRFNGTSTTASHVSVGLPIPAVHRVKIFSPDDWEGFTEEYAFSLQSEYSKVRRFGGSGDMGIDVACFCTDSGFNGGWDNYQCKRYDHALRLGDIWIELGKIIFYSFSGKYPVPRKHYFCASQGIGTTLEKLLNDSDKLKAKCRDEWAKHCESEITSTQTIPLIGTLLAYFNTFDFTIFSSKSVLDLIQGHSKTPFHAVRFGGGLPPRPEHEAPPDQPQQNESRYIRQLLDAYGEHASSEFADLTSLATNTELHGNFKRQRERFYHAESLRNFARDTVPEGTFAQLQEEIYQGVIDVCDFSHPNGFERMTAAVTQAASVSSTSNPLSPATKVQDRQGICHQLANDDRLSWVKKNG
jgi:hypothetical protein